MEIEIESVKFGFFGLLAFMGFLATWFSIERLMFFRKVNISQYNHKDLLNVDLTSNLTIIYTIGANAPYVGLVGTVVGILMTFHDIGMADGAIEISQVMVGLALALQVTAAGIALAIPCTMSYNGLMRKVDVLQAKFYANKDLKE